MTFLDDRTNLQPITVALVNNMPDSAFEDTENQFRAAAFGGASLSLQYRIPALKA